MHKCNFICTHTKIWYFLRRFSRNHTLNIMWHFFALDFAKFGNKLRVRKEFIHAPKKTVAYTAPIFIKFIITQYMFISYQILFR